MWDLSEGNMLEISKSMRSNNREKEIYMRLRKTITQDSIYVVW